MKQLKAETREYTFIFEKKKILLLGIIFFLAILNGCSSTQKMNQKSFEEWLMTYDTNDLFPGITNITYERQWKNEENQTETVYASFTSNIGNVEINGEYEFIFEYDKENQLHYSNKQTNFNTATLDEFVGTWREKDNKEKAIIMFNSSNEEQTISVYGIDKIYVAVLKSIYFGPWNTQGTILYTFTIEELSTAGNPYNLVFVYDIGADTYSLKDPDKEWVFVGSKGSPRSGSFFKD